MEQNATTLGIEEQHELLHQAKIEGGEPTIKARQKPNAEKTARVYQKLWNIRGTMAAGITQLQVPQDNTVSDYNECQEWISVETLWPSPQNISHPPPPPPPPPPIFSELVK